ncbi:hypothetical protein CBL_02388 [Carabus blaptoides fortunei]
MRALAEIWYKEKSRFILTNLVKCPTSFLSTSPRPGAVGYRLASSQQVLESPPYGAVLSTKIDQGANPTVNEHNTIAKIISLQGVLHCGDSVRIARSATTPSN